ncbi:hypothetical protein, partial [Ferrimicrobium acidiphilum]|uniref:hypothetical protein n=1 Tax=Ferrimicrobium acidiphilum TaxID=121039 RepID=UPI0023F49495
GYTHTKSVGSELLATDNHPDVTEVHLGGSVGYVYLGIIAVAAGSMISAFKFAHHHRHRRH